MPPSEFSGVSRVHVVFGKELLTRVFHKMTLKRIYREIADIRKEDLGDIVLGPSEDDLFLWKGVIPGPEGSCYESGKFNVDVKLAPDYPCVLRPTHLLASHKFWIDLGSPPQPSHLRLGGSMCSHPRNPTAHWVVGYIT
jgi:hypothetical protein